MKITKDFLRQLIKESIEEVTTKGDPGSYLGSNERFPGPLGEANAALQAVKNAKEVLEKMGKEEYSNDQQFQENYRKISEVFVYLTKILPTGKKLSSKFSDPNF